MVLEVLNFVSSYLNDRKQKTVYFNNESDTKNINYGVLQGSVIRLYYLYYL